MHVRPFFVVVSGLLFSAACGQLEPVFDPTDAASNAASSSALYVGATLACHLRNGVAKCWGLNDSGQLGLGDATPRGVTASDMGAALPAIDLGAGRKIVRMAVGPHSCAILDNGMLKCWGQNSHGELGLGDRLVRGDGPGEMGDALPAVDLGSGRRAVDVAVGFATTCALLDNGAVACWGHSEADQLGTGSAGGSIGDQPGEMGDALVPVDIHGHRATFLSSMYKHTCAVLDDGQVQCWGAVPGDLTGVVPLGSGRRAVEVRASVEFTCARFDDGAVKCWGENDRGELGLGDTRPRTTPAVLADALPVVDLGPGRRAAQLALGFGHTCVRLTDGETVCWGTNDSGQLGVGDHVSRGARSGEMGGSLSRVALGTGLRVTDLGAGTDRSCALLTGAVVKCWGDNSESLLGLGDTRDRGGDIGGMGDALPAVNLGW